MKKSFTIGNSTFGSDGPLLPLADVRQKIASFRVAGLSRPSACTAKLTISAEPVLELSGQELGSERSADAGSGAVVSFQHVIPMI